MMEKKDKLYRNRQLERTGIENAAINLQGTGRCTAVPGNRHSGRIPGGDG